MPDPYCYPGTGVLRNRLGLRSADLLAAFEARVTTTRMVEITVRPLPGRYDLAHLQEFHRHLFQDVHSWAGQLRTVDIAMPGTQFGHWRHLEAYLAEALTAVHVDTLLGAGQRHIAELLADVLGDLNAAHAFREGNGRTQRAFLSQMARAAGWQLRWNELDRDRNIEASAESAAGDPEPLRAALADICRAHPAGPRPFP